jgi:hypothetical protein
MTKTMVHIEEEFFTKRSALDFLRTYRTKFPGSKWGTNIRLSFDRLSRHWSVTGHRFQAA